MRATLFGLPASHPTLAAELNGFLKPKMRLFKLPLRFEAGALHLQAGFTPEIDRAALEAHRVAVAPIAATRVAAAS